MIVVGFQYTETDARHGRRRRDEGEDSGERGSDLLFKGGRYHLTIGADETYLVYHLPVLRLKRS